MRSRRGREVEAAEARRKRHNLRGGGNSSVKVKKIHCSKTLDSLRQKEGDGWVCVLFLETLSLFLSVKKLMCRFGGSSAV